MAKVIMTWKVMPENSETNLEDIKVEVKKVIEGFDGIINGEMTEEPLAFGLKFVKVSFAYDEDKGTTDDLEEELSSGEFIQSVEVLSVGRAMG
jgi:elongation factor 1-beta